MCRYILRVSRWRSATFCHIRSPLRASVAYESEGLHAALLTLRQTTKVCAFYPRITKGKTSSTWSKSVKLSLCVNSRRKACYVAHVLTMSQTQHWYCLSRLEAMKRTFTPVIHTKVINLSLRQPSVFSTFTIVEDYVL